MSGHHSRNDRDRHRANSSRSHYTTSSSKPQSTNSNDHHSRSHSSRSVMKSEDSGRSRAGGETNSSNSSRSFSNSTPAFTEVRISKLAKTLAMLETKKEFLSTCNQIEELILLQENQVYVQRSFARLAVEFEQIFYGLPGVPWKAIGVDRFTTFLSTLLETMGRGYNKMIQWIIDLTHEKAFHQLEILGVFQTVTLGMLPRMNAKHLSCLTGCIINVLEHTETTKSFKILSSLCMSSLLSNSEMKMSSFMDFIDVVFGWILSDTDESILPFCMNILNVMVDYFRRDMVFTTSMLTQLFDDFYDVGNTIKIQEVDFSETDRLLRLVKTTSAMLSLDCNYDKPYLTVAFKTFLSTVSEILENSHLSKKFKIELIAAVNECLSYEKIDCPELRTFIKSQLFYFNTSNGWMYILKTNLTSFVNCLSNWVEGTSIQIRSADDDAEKMLEETTKFIDIIRPLLEPDGQACIIRAVQSLLRTRNISCLQSSYNWLVSKLKMGEDNAADSETILFVLAGLSDIAGIKTGSILSQWALDPPIFDVLMSVLSWPICKEQNSPVQACALQLLRAHCEAHSNFVSSIASSKTFATEQAGSRNTRIVPTLMQFWLEILGKPETHYTEWLFDWIFGFIKASAPCATILVKSDQEFYENLLNKLFFKAELHSQLLILLRWFKNDQHYNKSDFILKILHDTASKFLWVPNISRSIQAESRALITSLRVSDAQLKPNRVNHNGGPVISGLNAPEQMHFSYITTFEFNSFLFNLLSYDKMESEVEYSSEYIKSTAEFLFQSKLRSSFGKPQEFFGHLGGLFRRYKLGKLATPKWKLDFVYQLEKCMVNAIHGSTFVPCNISEAIRSFYVTNRTPCMEWLKRMRPDLAGVSLSTEDYSYAFFSATAIGDELTTKFALLELKDLEGLKALNELGAYYYLQNDWSNAERFRTGSDKLDAFQDCMSKRIETALKEASSALKTWSDSTGIKTLDFYISKHLPEKLKIEGQLILQQQETNEPIESLQCLQIINTNSNSGEHPLTIQRLTTLVEASTTDPNVRSLHYINLADLFYKESMYDMSAQIYNEVTKMIDMNGHDLDSSLTTKIYLACASKLESSPVFFSELTPQWKHVCAFEQKDEVLQFCYQKAIAACPVDSSAWLEYGNFAYSVGQNSSSEPQMRHTMKALAQQCYSKCLILQNIGEQPNSPTKTRKNMQTKTRLLSLHKAGYKFNPEEVLIQDDWLKLLPSLVRSKDLRSHLVKQFPDQASFLTAAYSKERKFTRIIGRRGVFDSHAFTFTEASDEVFNPICHCDTDGKTKWNLINTLVGASQASVGTPEVEIGLEKDLINPNVYIVMDELQKIGTSREEFWSWAIERVLSDASKKLSALRKDMARESDVLKVKAYTLPLFTYLGELWSITKVANTASEVIFLNKYGSRIKDILKHLKVCTSPDEFNSAVDELITFGSMLDTSSVSRLDLHTVSPVLSNLEWNTSSAVHVPGFPPHVTLAGVHPNINCLHTKARPKRLSLRGSNGRLYDFLVKGNENLNIDSGVMQLLKISQDLVSLQTRTYSITPFGERGGLIQIVNNAQPVYIMYKRHLQRINCTERPAYMFFRMLNDLGFTDRSNFDALKTVYETLVKETDPEIISRELFICSENASNWLNSTRTFTQDSAVSASIGYLVGIGDRHLDNILLNPNNGNMIHVDFSLLFGRGETLQVPEIVPFRLTQNFVSCLQYPGINGPFRVYMENVFDSLKKYNDSFMFGVEEIALATQYEENATVDSGSILLSELHSAVELLRFRSKNIKNALQALKVEVLDIVDRKNIGFSWSVRSENMSSIEKLKRKLNRWRRLLANVDPLIQFIDKHAQPDAITMQSFQETVASVWLPHVIHFWCHTSVDKLFESTHLFPDQLNLADETLLLLLSSLPSSDATLECNELMLTKNEIEVDASKIQPQLLGTQEKFQSYNAEKVQELITNAMSADNLCQMFEGWTPWV